MRLSGRIRGARGASWFALLVAVLFTAAAAPAAAVPAVSISDAVVTEGNSGTVDAVFTISRNATDSAPTQVSYTTEDGSALAGSDYIAASGLASIPAFATQTTVVVKVNGDLNAEADETFGLRISSPLNGTIARDRGTGTILNDDAPAPVPAPDPMPGPPPVPPPPVQIGTPGKDTQIGTPGNDVQVGNGGHDTQKGNAGNDLQVPDSTSARLCQTRSQVNAQVDAAEATIRQSVPKSLQAPFIAQLEASRAQANAQMDALLAQRGGSCAKSAALASAARSAQTDDRLDGGSGDDLQDAGPGKDILTGGSGLDVMLAGSGDDTLRSRDGERDVLRCGSGLDTVLADRQDVVGKDCERVRR